MMPICFVDTETTGLHTDKQLWEVAIIRREFVQPVPGKQETYDVPMKETRYEAFVPVDLSNADLHGLNVGKFYERHPMGRWLSGRQDNRDYVLQWADMDEHAAQLVARNVAKFTHGARFIGAAPSFDAEVLGDFLRKHGLLPTWHHRLVDTHDLLTGYLLGKADEGTINLPGDPYELSKQQKEGLAGIATTHPELVHTAMGDAQHEADIWDAVMS